MTPSDAVPHDFAIPATGQGKATTAAPRSASQRAPLPRAVLLTALLLGVAADALLRDGPDGLGISIFFALAALAAFGIAQRADRGPTAEALGWLGAAAIFGSGIALRADDALQVFDFFAAAFSLGMSTVVIAGAPIRGIAFARLRDLVRSAAMVALDAIGGVVTLVTRDGALATAAPRNTAKAWTGVRAVLITVPVVAFFATLLFNADPIFASWLWIPDFRIDEFLSHIVITGFFAWTTAGWLRRGALAGAEATGTVSDNAFTDLVSLRLGATEITALLGSLVVLFALFIGAQIGWFFGGETMLQARTGLTASEYARRGFFEMVWVALLVIPLLLATRVTIGDDPALRTRHTRLAIPLVVLVFAILLSAAARMRLYVDYFGLTDDRFYALMFMAWLAFVLVWLIATVLRERGRTFIAGAVLSALTVLAALNLVDPSGVIARVNLGRATAAAADEQRSVDVLYLAGLDDGAVPLVLNAVLAAPSAPPSAAPSAAPTDTAVSAGQSRCAAANTLLRRWGPLARHPEGAEAFRRWNLGERRSRALVAPRTQELLAVAHSCPRPARAAAAVTPASTR